MGSRIQGGLAGMFLLAGTAGRCTSGMSSSSRLSRIQILQQLFGSIQTGLHEIGVALDPPCHFTTLAYLQTASRTAINLRCDKDRFVVQGWSLIRRLGWDDGTLSWYKRHTCRYPAPINKAWRVLLLSSRSSNLSSSLGELAELSCP